MGLLITFQITKWLKRLIPNLDIECWVIMIVTRIKIVFLHIRAALVHFPPKT